MQRSGAALGPGCVPKDFKERHNDGVKTFTHAYRQNAFSMKRLPLKDDHNSMSQAKSDFKKINHLNRH